jgi:sugar lactone lactonase YvrE
LDNLVRGLMTRCTRRGLTRTISRALPVLAMATNAGAKKEKKKKKKPAPPTCQGSLQLCGGTCVDMQTSGAHCGGCGDACPHQLSECIAGECRAAYEVVTAWGGQGTENGKFQSLGGVAVDSAGNVYVADVAGSRVQKSDNDGAVIKAIGAFGIEAHEFINPLGIAIDQNDDLYVTDYSLHSIKKFDSDGGFITSWGSFDIGDYQLYCPQGVAVDKDGNVFVVQACTTYVKKFTSSGTYLTKWDEAASDVAVDSAGAVYLFGPAGLILKSDGNGTSREYWASFGSDDLEDRFNVPRGGAVDGVDNVYVVEERGRRIQKFTKNGEFLTVWGNPGDGDGQFNAPYRIAVDSAGNAFVTDTGNFRIHKFAPVNGAARKAAASRREQSKRGHRQERGHGPR